MGAGRRAPRAPRRAGHPRRASRSPAATAERGRGRASRSGSLRPAGTGPDSHSAAFPAEVLQVQLPDGRRVEGPQRGFARTGQPGSGRSRRAVPAGRRRVGPRLTPPRRADPGPGARRGRRWGGPPAPRQTAPRKSATRSGPTGEELGGGQVDEADVGVERGPADRSHRQMLDEVRQAAGHEGLVAPSETSKTRPAVGG